MITEEDRVPVRRSDRLWETLGAEDAYYGVLTHPRFHAGALTEEARAEFFDTGERHVDRLFATIRRTLDPDFAPRDALDFGCGVGRLVLPFARRCARVTGVDIAPSMLQEAARNVEQAGLANVEFALSDDTLSRVRGEYDLVHTYIVLQHLGPGRGCEMVRRLAARVRPGGVAALHLLYARRESTLRAILYRLRRDVPGFELAFSRLRPDRGPHLDGLTQMNPMPLVPVFEILRTSGFGEVHLGFSDHGNAATALPGAFLLARRVVEPLW